MRPQAIGVCGLKLPVYEAFSYQCMRPWLLVYAVLS
jgi:hypothetical protein